MAKSNGDPETKHLICITYGSSSRNLAVYSVQTMLNAMGKPDVTVYCWERPTKAGVAFIASTDQFRTLDYEGRICQVITGQRIELEDFDCSLPKRDCIAEEVE